MRMGFITFPALIKLRPTLNNTIIRARRYEGRHTDLRCKFMTTLVVPIMVSQAYYRKYICKYRVPEADRNFFDRMSRPDEIFTGLRRNQIEQVHFFLTYQNQILLYVVAVVRRQTSS